MEFKRLSVCGERWHHRVQGGGGEIGTMTMAPTRCVIPPPANVQNRCELAEGVGSGAERVGVGFKIFSMG